jgi:hypothetical protein
MDYPAPTALNNPVPFSAPPKRSRTPDALPAVRHWQIQPILDPSISPLPDTMLVPFPASHSAALLLKVDQNQPRPRILVKYTSTPLTAPVPSPIPYIVSGHTSADIVPGTYNRCCDKSAFHGSECHLPGNPEMNTD